MVKTSSAIHITKVVRGALCEQLSELGRIEANSDHLISIWYGLNEDVNHRKTRYQEANEAKWILPLPSLWDHESKL